MREGEEMDRELELAQRETLIEATTARVLREEAASLGFHTVARVRARLAAYDKIYSNFLYYIERQSELLASGMFEGSPYKELSVARLISLWLIESERFFKEVEPLLKDTGEQVRKGFLEKSFEALPEEKREEIMAWFNNRKQELLLELVKKITEARRDE